MSSDFSSKCRTCLSDSNFFHQLFDYVDAKYKILEMIEGIVPQIDINCNTKFSSLVCQPCVDKLLTGYKFQQMCIENNNRLHDMLGIAVAEREPKLENDLDPLTEERAIKVKQEIEDDVFYAQEINLDELEASIRPENDGVWEPPATSVCDSKEILHFQCPDCFKSFENIYSLSSHYKVHKEKNDDKFLCKDKRVNTSTEVDNIETWETDYNKDDNKLSVCVKEEYEKRPHIFRESTQESETNGDLFSNSSQDSDGNFAENKISLSADSRAVHDNKLAYKDNEFDTSTKVDKFDTLETGNYTANELRICVKNELEITPQTLEEHMEEFEENSEFLSNNSEFSNSDESEEELFAKPVKSTKDSDSEDTGIAKIKKSRNCSGNYTCEVCGRIFAQAFVFKRHKLVHSPSRPYECEICKYRFATSTALKGHLFQHKNGTFESLKSYSRPDGFKCPDCPRRFEKRTSLSVHRRTHSYNYSNYPCIHCQKFFTTIRALTIHIVEKHPELKKRHKCDQCGKYFILHALLVEHLNRHKGNNNVVCLICEEEFGSGNDLTEHMRTHSNYADTSIDQMPSDKGVHLCPHCGKTFSKDVYLQRHLPRHSEFKKYQCSECPKRFNIKSDLERHIATHTNAKPHACNLCGSCFTRSSSLQKHKRTIHSDERPFKCDQCSLAFALVYQLKQHMRTHTGEKPYKCKYCERAYAINGDLTKHLRTHLGENTYICDQCPMTFKYHVELKKHQSEHYKMAQKFLQQSQQMPDESQQHEIIDNKSIQSSTNTN